MFEHDDIKLKSCPSCINPEDFVDCAQREFSGRTNDMCNTLKEIKNYFLLHEIDSSDVHFIQDIEFLMEDVIKQNRLYYTLWSTHKDTETELKAAKEIIGELMVEMELAFDDEEDSENE